MVSRIFAADSSALCEWARGIVPHFPEGFAFGVENNGEIAAVIAYTGNEWNWDISIASVSPKWATRAILREMFRIPFDEGALRVSAQIAKKNKQARNFAKRCGLREEGCIRKGYLGTDDLIFYGAFKKELPTWAV